MSATMQGQSKTTETRYRIGALLLFQNEAGQVLLLRRKRPPNLGRWCAVGGKLEMDIGESPYECAIREAEEEVRAELTAADLELRCILAERDYEQTGHWLMFVFKVAKPVAKLPEPIDEGEFGFFEQEELSHLEMPELDRKILIEQVLGGNANEVVYLRTTGGPESLVVEGGSGVRR